MNNKVTIDDYFNNGMIEAVRFGNVTRFTNVMSKAQADKILRDIASRYDEIKNNIDSKIETLRKEVSECNPILLLHFASDVFRTSIMGTYSEIQIDQDRMASGRFCEYMQSIIVSTPDSGIRTTEDQSSLFFKILSLFEDLYEDVQLFCYSWAAKAHIENNMKGTEEDGEILEELLLYFVRGNRYPVFQFDYHKNLLTIHNDEFVRQFGMTADEVVEGFSKLEHTIVHGKIESLNKWLTTIDDRKDIILSDEELFAQYEDEFKNLIESFFTVKNNDVKMITGWPESFARGLSYQVGEASDFFNAASGFAGWPILELPVQRRPFVTIDDKTYCFDYYSFTDNFYRAVQRLLCSNNPAYANRWKDFQASASEEFVATILSSLLPGCKVHKNNYYPREKSTKQMNENDLLIEYEDALLILEIKAGSFSYTSPLYDYESHVRAYQNLIERADHQCNRTYEYILTHDNAVFYTQDRKCSFFINKKNYNFIYQLSVSLDNINGVAARAEKMSFLKLKSNAISISIDDLMAYKEYFDSQWDFMHYLKQRKEATSVKVLSLYDELDHLGLYICNNCYTFGMEQLSTNNKYSYVGYREELDRYFGLLYHDRAGNKKPKQDIPERFLNIVNAIGKSGSQDKIWLTSYMLDFSEELKKGFLETIDSIYKRQAEEGKTLPLLYSGDQRSIHLTAFLKQHAVAPMKEKEIDDYIYATMIWNQEELRVRLDITYDQNGTVTDVYGKKYLIDEVKEDEYNRLMHIGKENAEARIERYKKRTGKNKIGRNERCPCGSGKKYKHCCGKN